MQKAQPVDVEREARQFAHLEFIAQFSVGMRGHLLEHPVYVEMTRRHEEMMNLRAVLQMAVLPMSRIDEWIMKQYRRAAKAQDDPHYAAGRAAYNAVATFGLAEEIRGRRVGGDEEPMWAGDAETAKEKALKKLGFSTDYEDEASTCSDRSNLVGSSDISLDSSDDTTDDGDAGDKEEPKPKAKRTQPKRVSVKALVGRGGAGGRGGRRGGRRGGGGASAGAGAAGAAE